MDWAPFVIVLVIAVAIASAAYHYNRAASILQSWAAGNGFRILSSERCWFWRGPFFLRSGKSQEVYRVTIQDGAGRTRCGYVRCGGFFLGMLSNQADVVWDPEPKHIPGFPVVFPGRKDK
jgi:hypothetical protein